RRFPSSAYKPVRDQTLVSLFSQLRYSIRPHLVRARAQIICRPRNDVAGRVNPIRGDTMNKKVMALAVAGAFAAPAAAFAQASNVQIFGTMYLEYAYAKQGAIAGPSGGDLVNVDIMQTPGS